MANAGAVNTIPKVYQFEICLLEIEPKIWRQIQVPSTFNMFDLHGALNSAMGWNDTHYHVFKVLNPKTNKNDSIGRPFNGSDKKGLIDGRNVKMTTYFIKPGDNADYLYDFGDRWEHKVELQRIIPAVNGKEYPICINGKRACPPEDCGSFDGYNNLLTIIKDPNHPEYTRMMQWLSIQDICRLDYSGYDPEKFDPAKVDFWPSELRQYCSCANAAEASFYDCNQM